MRKKKSASKTLFWTGFAIMVVASLLYVKFGAWGKIPGLTMSKPSHTWARAVFSPGLWAGNLSYKHIFRGYFGFKDFRIAADCAGGVGVLFQGIIGGLLVMVFLRKK